MFLKIASIIFIMILCAIIRVIFIQKEWLKAIRTFILIGECIFSFCMLGLNFSRSEIRYFALLFLAGAIGLLSPIQKIDAYIKKFTKK